MTNTTTKPSAMQELLDQEAASFSIPQVGDLVTGTVISVAKGEVHLDVDGVTTGVVRGRELFDESGMYSDLKIGDKAEATVLELENEMGEMELSFRTAGHRRAWDELTKLMRDGLVIDVPVLDANRGGLLIKVSRIDGFLPVSQLTPEHYPRVEGGDKNRILEHLGKFVGQKFRVKVIDVNETDEKLIVSEKAAWEEEQRDLIRTYHNDDVITGRVTGVVDFGCFVEFGPGLEGLVHISEMAWQRVENPRTIVKVGDEVRAQIIGIEGMKISLSFKRLTDDPWKKAAEKYTVGETVKGKIVKLNPFGAFVELDPEIQGLAHISELSAKQIAHPREVVKEGETYDFKVLTLEPKDHRLGLSRKALEEPVAEDAAPTDAPATEAPVDAPSDDVMPTAASADEPEPAVPATSDIPEVPPTDRQAA